MEVQRHWQEELEGLRPFGFPAIFAFAESSDLRQRRMVGGCAHRFDVLFKSDREDNHFRFLPCLKHSPEVVVVSFFQCPFSFFQNPLPLMSTLSCVSCPESVSFPVSDSFCFPDSNPAFDFCSTCSFPDPGFCFSVCSCVCFS